MTNTENINDLLAIIRTPINSKNIQVIKYTENDTDIIFHFIIDTIPIKITTDFDKYCLAETAIDIYNLSTFNLSMIFKNKKPKIIIDEIIKVFNINPSVQQNITTNHYHIFQKVDEFTKVLINYSDLQNSFLKLIETNKTKSNITKIPKALLLSQLQISKLIINEIKNVNRNRDHEHYVFPDIENPYNLNIRIKFNKDSEVGILFQHIHSDHGYDYIEIKLLIDRQNHPYIPPKLEYIKPKIKLPLLLSLMNLDILKLENWNSIITLDYFITNLALQLETHIKDNIIIDSKLTYNELEYELIKLASITKDYKFDKIMIQIHAPKIMYSETNTKNKYWKSGTGYGNEGQQKWDISTFIKEQELQNIELISCLKNINSLITIDTMNKIYDSSLIKYLINQVSGLNILELETNKDLYYEIFNILTNIADKNLSQIIINSICKGLKNIFDEINMFINSSNENFDNEFILQTVCLCDWYLSKYEEPIIPIIISTDNKEKYCEIMKKLQFGTYQIPDYHRFNSYKNEKIEKKALMRILSEISSFKSSLPLNWESTIWIRIPKESFNIISFLICGPKDTPYENGLFEFHAYFPYNYPNTVPQVLLHTTGNNKVRFNPNLYDSGKVCLSLLGTWAGQAGEQWNPKTSTFLQVLVSIQSLILVEQPYFNEPGWERDLHTVKGKQNSYEYNENLHSHTIKLAMIDMLKNPPNGFEEVISNHFKMKKEEIINKTEIWAQESNKNKLLIKKNRNELLEIFNIL
jgi:ubiquitin-protein ligase